MSKKIWSYIILIFGLLLSCELLSAQIQENLPFIDTSGESDLTVSYSLNIKSLQKEGYAETYNGGLKTLFISKGRVRNRLVSLMRMQSVFYFRETGNRERTIAIVKESGKDKYKTYLSLKEWQQYNRKYDSSTCILSNDSILILGYQCKKATIILSEEQKIVVFYTELIRNSMFEIAEPAFAGIPGLVLQYTYENERAVLTYTAVSISDLAIAPAVFQIPAMGYPVRKFVQTNSR